MKDSIKQQVDLLLNKPMNRRGFLRHVGIGVVALTGATALLKAVAPATPTTRPTQPATSMTYGSSAYGGVSKSGGGTR